MEDYSVRRKIQMLLTEENNLKKSIIELEKKFPHKSNTSRFKRKFDTDTRIDSTSIENISNLKKWLHISQKINNINFINEEVILLDDGSRKCAADAVTRSTNFHVNLRVQDKQKEMIIHSLKVKFKNPFQEKELRSWANRCEREKDFQILINGIISYAKWYRNREDVINWLESNCGSYCIIGQLKEDGAVSIKTRSSHLFVCKWSIMWNRSDSCMIPSFVFQLNKSTQFFRENEHLFKKLSSVKITMDEVIDMWKRIFVGVMAVKEFETATSESESEMF